jgi:hypothetical protein
MIEKKKHLLILYILISISYYLFFKDTNYYWQNNDSLTYLEVGRVLYEDKLSVEYLFYLLSNNLMGMGLIGLTSFIIMPDGLNLILVFIFNLVIFFYITNYCERIANNLNIKLKNIFYLVLFFNPLFISYMFSINKELIGCLLVLIFIEKVIKNEGFYSFILLIFFGAIIRDALGAIFLITLIILLFKINILYFLIINNFLAEYSITGNTLVAFSGDDGYSIFDLNDIFIWMQNNYLYFIVVPLKFIIAALSGLPVRSGLPELDNIIGYCYLMSSFIILITIFNLKKLCNLIYAMKFRKIRMFFWVYSSIMLLPPFINQRYLIPIYPLIFLIFLSNNEKNT